MESNEKLLDQLSVEGVKQQAGQQIRGLISKPENVEQTDSLNAQDEMDRESDRELKRHYGKKFLWVLASQLLVMNVVFVFVGYAWIRFDRWTLEIYLSGTLLQVFGVVLVITKSLFPAERPAKKP